jgi:hypothetical protein
MEKGKLRHWRHNYWDIWLGGGGREGGGYIDRRDLLCWGKKSILTTHTHLGSIDSVETIRSPIISPQLTQAERLPLTQTEERLSGEKRGSKQCVSDPWGFNTDPYPWIGTTRWRILFFSSVVFKMPTKNKFVCLLLTVGIFTYPKSSKTTSF